MRDRRKNYALPKISCPATTTANLTTSVVAYRSELAFQWLRGPGGRTWAAVSRFVCQ